MEVLGELFRYVGPDELPVPRAEADELDRVSVGPIMIHLSDDAADGPNGIVATGKTKLKSELLRLGFELRFEQAVHVHAADRNVARPHEVRVVLNDFVDVDVCIDAWMPTVLARIGLVHDVSPRTTTVDSHHDPKAGPEVRQRMCGFRGFALRLIEP